MRLMKNQWLRTGKWMGICLIGIALVSNAYAQAFSTTTVQGTVYLANGMPGSGTLQLNWPAFTTANNQAVAAGRTVAAIGADGFVSVNLAPNVGSFPGGLFYTAVYNMSDGSSNTEYWVVPAAAQATIAQVRAQVMPAAQAVHAVNKAYVDQAIQSLSQNYLAPSGGTLTGPLYLNGDPSQAMQAADKHYVDSTFSQAVPLTGASLTGPLTSVQLGAAYQADQFAGADFGAKLQACLAAVSAVSGGTCDARNFTGNQSMASNLTISTANTTVMLPCATISTASQVIVTAGTRNVALRGCALRGASNASGSQGGTVFQYSGVGAMIQVGDPTYAADTLGFHFDSAVINTTAATNSTAQALTAYRTQEMDLQSLYFLGNSNQTGMTLDGTGNYTGGTFYDNAFNGFQTAVNAIGHQVENSATTDWLNASTFVRLHIDCPTSSGNPINGTYGINLQQGDGNTFTGGDVEGCNIALHLGPNAQNNTIVGLRNENSNNQVVADSGSSYNNWMTGGTMFTGKLTDNGTRNSFLDTFHRSFNGMNGDWYGSQQDATVTNHFRLGTGNGNERGLLDRYQTDFGYRWTTGLSDATAGEQFYQVLDELNNVYRLSIGQYNNGQSSTNNQTVINAAGTGAVVLNGSNNSGTGGVVIGSGGIASATVATINNAGSAQFNGTLQVGSTSTFAGSTTVRNQADAEIDAFLWAGATANQKESLTYKDYAGASQWYVVKDASNNWALNSATGGLDSFKAYQSTNSGDTYINASNPSGVVRINYEGGAGTGFNVYGGNSSTLYAGFTGTTSIKFPGLAASSGHNCLQIDNSGYMTNTGSACGSGGGSGTVNSGASGQIAYYSAAGTVLSGMSAVPVASGGTGATSAAGALISLGAASLTAMGTQSFASPLNGPAVNSSVNSQVNVMAPPFNARGDCVTDDHDAIQAAMSAAAAYNPTAVVYFPRPAGGCYLTSTLAWNGVSLQGQPGMGTTYNTAGVSIQGKAGEDVFEVPSPSTVTTSAPNRTWSVRDLRIVVDDSVAGSFPHRWPGRWVSDAAITSGSATFTSSNSLITCGDIGQAILVKGAGIAGADLSTTISSVSPCWAGSQTPTSQVITLAAAASTTVAADQAYISVGNIPLTVTIGACGIAFDDIDGKQADNTMSGPVGNLYDTLRDVSFNSVGGGYGKNSSCALYFQGWWGPYGLDARNVNIGGVYYGVVEGSSETNSSFSTGGNDFQKWDHGLWSATYPWISYNGGDNKLEDIQLQGLNGPQILQFGNIWSDAANNWNIDMPEFAHVSGGATGWRIEGYAHTFLGTALGEDGTYTQPTLFDASDSQCLNCSMLGVLTINGSHNRLSLTSNLDPSHVTDMGLGNTVTGSYLSSPVYGYPVGRFYAVNNTRGDKAAGIVTSDFIRTGNLATPYMSDLDLLFWPDDFAMNGALYPPSVSADSNSLTGKFISWYQNATVTKFTSAAYLNNGGTALIGSRMVPATQAVVYISASCPTIASYTFTVLAGNTSLAGNSFSCSASYSTASVSVDMSSYSGSALGFRVNGTGSAGPASGVNVAYIAVSPFNAGLNLSGPINFGNTGTASATLANLGGLPATGGTLTGPVAFSGAGTASTTLANLGAQAALTGISSDGASGITVTGKVTSAQINANVNGQINVMAPPYNAVGDWNGTTGTDNTSAFAAACAAAIAGHKWLYIPAGSYLTDTISACNGNTVHITGAGIDRTYLIPKNGDTVFQPSGTAGISSFYMADLTITGNGGSGNGIYLPATLAFVQNVDIERVKVLGIPGKAIFLPSAFSTYIGNSSASSTTDNAFEINGGPAVTLVNDYALDAGPNKAGFRVHSGNALLIGDNGLNTSHDYESWGVFGDETAGDGDTAYAEVTLINCNIESFSKYGLWVKNGSTVNLTNDSIFNNNTWSWVAGDTVEGILMDNAQFASTIDGLTNMGNIAGTAPWTNGYGLHASNGAPFTLHDYVSGGRQASLITYWNDASAVAATTPYEQASGSGLIIPNLALAGTGTSPIANAAVVGTNSNGVMVANPTPSVTSLTSGTNVLVGPYNANSTGLYQANYSSGVGNIFTSYSGASLLSRLYCATTTNCELDLGGSDSIQNVNNQLLLGNGYFTYPTKSYEPMTMPSISGQGTASFAAGVAAGSSPGTAACATSHVCDSMSGTISLTTGTATTTGALLTVTTGLTRTNQPNCIGTAYLVASPYTALPVRLTYTNSTIVFNIGAAPAASTAYELVYAGCGGN